MRPIGIRSLVFGLFVSFPSSHASGQSSGLLLGIGTEFNEYRTLLIGRVDGRLIVAADRPALIVPRSDGWWRADVDTHCSVNRRAAAEVGGSGDGSVLFLDQMDSLLVAPVRRWAPLGDDHCLEAEREVTAESTRAADEGDRCYTDHLWLTYVSPRLLSIRREAETSEHCNPGRNTSETTQRVVDWAGESVPLLPHLSPAQAATLSERFEAERGDCALQDSPDEAWGLARATGRWVVTFRTSGAVACAGNSGGEVHDLERVPAALAPSEASGRWMAVLRKRHADLVDVYAAPKGDLVVARRRERLVVYAPNGTELGAPVHDVPLPHDSAVVMVEWAEGSHVARWARELSALALP